MLSFFLSFFFVIDFIDIFLLLFLLLLFILVLQIGPRSRLCMSGGIGVMGSERRTISYHI